MQMPTPLTVYDYCTHVHTRKYIHEKESNGLLMYSVFSTLKSDTSDSGQLFLGCRPTECLPDSEKTH